MEMFSLSESRILSFLMSSTLHQIATDFSLVLENFSLTMYRMKQAAADPKTLTQEQIVQNLDSAERNRLSRIRNIGIAVWFLQVARNPNVALIYYRHILIVVKQHVRNESCSTLDGLTLFMK